MALAFPVRTCIAAVLLCCVAGSLRADSYDLVLQHGRVMDPETKLDAVRDVGVKGGKIAAVSEQPLSGTTVVDARGLVVAPGFIDLHQHAFLPEDYPLKALDGVTTVAELEVGTAEVDKWYALREGRTPLNFAVSVGHIPCRMAVMGDAPALVPPATAGAATRVATDEEEAKVCAMVEQGLKRGAVAVGFGLQYTPGATQRETVDVFQVAARYHASCHVHLRAKGASGPQNVYAATLEVIAASAITGAPVQICHVQSTANRLTPRVMDLVEEARAHGIDCSVECYPYTAGMTDLKSAIFDPGWQERAQIDYGDLQWAATGERLNAETFARYREQGGMVIVHSNSEEVIREIVGSPLTMIASDGLRGHPRHAGTSARVLGRYVREEKVITLMQALAKLSLWPAQRLEARVPAMKNKGRLRVGADADLVLFDPATVIDRATYSQPDLASAGIAHVLVGGAFVVRDSNFQENTFPGRAVRAPIAN